MVHQNIKKHPKLVVDLSWNMSLLPSHQGCDGIYVLELEKYSIVLPALRTILIQMISTLLTWETLEP